MGIRQRAAAVVSAAALLSVLNAAPALAQTSFTVASISVPYGSGIVQQTIAVTGPVVGTTGDLVIIANTGMQYLVSGLTVSPSTHAVCTQVYNNHYMVQWHCVPSGTWGAGTFAVLMDTGSPSQVFPPGTGPWPDAETTSIADAGVGGAQASGTLSLLPPGPRVPPSVPVTTLPNPAPSKPATTHTTQANPNTATKPTIAPSPSPATPTDTAPSTTPPSSSATAPAATTFPAAKPIDATAATPAHAGSTTTVPIALTGTAGLLACATATLLIVRRRARPGNDQPPDQHD
jgi:hypothetical protein